jgi:hypothetical protein
VPRPLLAEEAKGLEGGDHRLSVDPDTGTSRLTTVD